MPVLMELNKIIISEMQDQQIIVLKEVNGDRQFPILISSDQAIAIGNRLKGSTFPRPMTHDLLANVIQQLGGTLERIEITHLESHTFFARLQIKQDNQTLSVDSRPSDAIALGIAGAVPIYVAGDVLDEACR